MQKKLRLILVVFFGLVGLLSHYTVLEAESESSTREKSMLWEVQTDSGTDYIFGSIHLIPKEMYPLADTVEKAYEASDVLVVEADIMSNKLAMSRKLLKKGSYSSGKSLKDELKPELFKKVRKLANEYGGAALRFNTFKPWAAYLTIQSAVLQKQLIQKRGWQKGHDHHFLKKAHEQKKEIKEMEGVGAQFDLFANLSKELQRHLLKDLVKDPESNIKETKELVELYQKGDPEKMAEFTFEKQYGFSDEEKQKDKEELKQKKKMKKRFLKKFFYERNNRWMKKIKSFLKSEKTHFIVVGNGHLIGKKGVISMLEKEGFNPVQK